MMLEFPPPVPATGARRTIRIVLRSTSPKIRHPCSDPSLLGLILGYLGADLIEVQVRHFFFAIKISRKTSPAIRTTRDRHKKVNPVDEKFRAIRLITHEESIMAVEVGGETEREPNSVGMGALRNTIW